MWFFAWTQLSQFLPDFYPWGMKKVLFFKGIPFLTIFFMFVCFPWRYGQFKFFRHEKNSKNPQIKKNINVLYPLCKRDYQHIMHQKEAYRVLYSPKHFLENQHAFGSLMGIFMKKLSCGFENSQNAQICQGNKPKMCAEISAPIFSNFFLELF